MATTNESQTVTQLNQDQWSHTLRYVGVAVSCLVVTAAANWMSGPAKIQDFGKVGQVFYPDFTDPTLASGLDVFVFDNEEVRAREFKVARQENGLWVIPSHHHYPADAEERLAKTASSIIGIKRGALVTRWSADHGRYGVINPKQDTLNVEDVEGVGKRLTLRKDDQSVLADFVIGKQVDEKTDEFYVRHPDEDEVYIAKLEIDLSTKFTDWIEDKLFDFSNGDVLQLDIHDYVFDNRTVTESIVTNLSREEAWSSDWNLVGLDTETQEVDTQKINDALSALSGLEVIGIRPKQKGLTPELTLDREFLRSQNQLDVLQQDLFARGFALQQGDTPEQLALISREGELIAGTENGLRYQLYFGEVFTGSEEELEIGFANGAGDQQDTEEKPAEGNAEAAQDGGDAENTDADDSGSSGKPGRYLFVRVSFDENLLSGPRSAPIEPEKPARLRELEAEEKEKDTDDAEKADEKSVAEQDATDAGAGEEAAEEPSELETLREAYESARELYETDLRDYESRQEKIKEGQEKAEEFNRRFAEWYYVVAGDSFEKLDIARADLIKLKEAGEAGAGDGAAATGPENVPPFIPPPGAATAFDNLPATGNEPDGTEVEVIEQPAAEEPTVDSPDAPADDDPGTTDSEPNSVDDTAGADE